jgi:hypothetical protein
VPWQGRRIEKVGSKSTFIGTEIKGDFAPPFRTLTALQPAPKTRHSFEAQQIYKMGGNVCADCCSQEFFGVVTDVADMYPVYLSARGP